MDGRVEVSFLALPRCRSDEVERAGKGEPGFRRAALPRDGERTHMDVRAGKRSMDGCLRLDILSRAGALLRPKGK